METLSGLGGLAALFVITGAILAILLPFFVYRIRNEIISINEKLSTLIRLIANKQEDWNIEITDKGKRVKICQHCGAKNRPKDWTCLSCSQPI